MYANTAVTLYRLINGVYERSIHTAFWDSSQIAVFQKTGVYTGIKAVVFIPYNDEELTFTPEKDYAVKGECDIEIDNSTPQALSESMKALKEYGFVTITGADTLLYGSPDMWHYQIACK